MKDQERQEIKEAYLRRNSPPNLDEKIGVCSICGLNIYPCGQVASERIELGDGAFEEPQIIGGGNREAHTCKGGDAT